MNLRSERRATQTAEMVKDIRVLETFYAAWEDGNISNEPVYKEKFDVAVSGTQHFSKVAIKT